MKTILVIFFLFSSYILFAQQPTLVLPLGHISPVSDVSFSPDGKFAATNGSQEEMQAKIWEVASGKLVKTIDGHADKITSIKFSPDGKYILTTARDHTAKVWDVHTGELYYDIYYNSSNWVEKGFFTADSKKILLVSSDAMEYFDLRTKKFIHLLADTLSYRVTENGSKWRHEFVQIDVNPFKELAVTTGSDSAIRVWDLNKGVLLHKIKDGKSAYYSCNISNSGNIFLAAALDGNIHLIGSKSGSLTRSISMPQYVPVCASFSPDERKIITASVDAAFKKSPIEIWDTETGKKERQIELAEGIITMQVVASPDNKQLLSFSSDGIIRLWEMSTGKLVREISRLDVATSNEKKTLDESEMRFLVGAFSQDGNKIIASSYNNIATIQDARTGKIISRLEGLSSLMYNPRYSPDGNYFATLGVKENVTTGQMPVGIAYIWDIQSGKQAFSLQGHTRPINDLQYSKDGEWLATFSEDSTAKIWDTRSGKLIRTFDTHEKGVYRGFISGDKKYLVTQTFSGVARIWDTENGLHVALVKHDSLTPSRNGIYTLTPSKTGKYFKIVFYDDYKTIIVETTTGKTLLSFDTKKDSSSLFTFIPGEKLVVYQQSGKVIIQDIESSRIQNAIPYQSKITDITVNNKGNLLAISSGDSAVRLWEISTGKLNRTLRDGVNRVNDANFTEDDKYITVNTYRDRILVWNLENNTEWILPIAADDMYGFNLTRNGRHYMFTRSYESVLKIWDIDNGKLMTSVADKYNSSLDYILHPTKPQFIIDSKFSNEIYTIGSSKPWLKFIPVSSTDYLTTDSMGRFDGTDAARKLLYFTCGTEIIELDQAKDQLWVPNLTERLGKGEPINAKTLGELNICGLTPEVKDAGSNAGQYLFRIRPRRGGIGETVLYVNGIEARRYSINQLKKQAEWYELAVKKDELQKFFIAGQENVVTAKAYTTGNAISSRGAVVTSKEEQQVKAFPNLYAVMIGVSDYKGSELDLKYAAKDAGDISNAVALAARKLLNTDGKEHVFIYNLTTAKERFQLPEKNAVKKLMEEIGKKATAADVLLIFFAGHGVMSGEGDKKQFYFLTADASSLGATGSLADVGISTTELAEWMKPQYIKAQKRILVFDACNSGQAIKDFVKMGNEDQQYLAARNDDKSQLVKAIDKLNEKSGLFILSASASDQNAYEMGRYSQGLLTYSLLKAIKQDPDILEDGKYLNVSRWFNAAEKTASELSRETGARQEPQIVSTTNFNIGIVDAEVMSGIILPQEKPLFAASNFQNNDEAIADDDLELSKMVNLGLSDLSKRGADSKIVYVTATNSPEAYNLSGRYNIKSNTITITVNLKQNRQVKNKFEVSGTKEKLDALVLEIVNKATSLIQ